MDKSKNIHDEVDRIMQAMDNMEKLEAGPYFYTRIEARLKSRKQEALKKRSLFSLKTAGPVLRPAFMALLLLVNIVSGVIFMTGTPVADSNVSNSVDKPLHTYISGLTSQYWQSNETFDEMVAEKMVVSEKEKTMKP